MQWERIRIYHNMSWPIVEIDYFRCVSRLCRSVRVRVNILFLFGSGVGAVYIEDSQCEPLYRPRRRSRPSADEARGGASNMHGVRPTPPRAECYRLRESRARRPVCDTFRLSFSRSLAIPVRKKVVNSPI